MAAVAARRSGRPMLRGCRLLTLPSVARSSRRSPDIGHHQPVEADVIVAGLGAHGSATAYALSKRGASVLGFDRFARGHTLGSSGGRSRIIRTAYYEHSDYVPLLRRAWERWRELERESGEHLLTETGGLYAGPPDGELVGGALKSRRSHGVTEMSSNGCPFTSFRTPIAFYMASRTSADRA